MIGIYPDDYEKPFDAENFKKAIEYLAQKCLHLDELREFRDAVKKGKKRIINAVHYCPEELNRIAKVMNCSDVILYQLDAIEKAMMEKDLPEEDGDKERSRCNL